MAKDKYLNNLAFQFDHVFGPEESTEALYSAACEPAVRFLLEGGHSTVMAYGQTGSGKTYTMSQVQAMAVNDIFNAIGDCYCPGLASLCPALTCLCPGQN